MHVLCATLMLSLPLCGCKIMPYTPPAPVKPSIHSFLGILPGQTCAHILPQYKGGLFLQNTKCNPELHDLRGRIADIVVITYFDPPASEATAVEYSIDGPTAMTTPDGITLGRDTLATVANHLHVPLQSLPFEATHDRDTSSSTTRVEMTVPPRADFPFQGTYSLIIDGKRVESLPAKANIHDLANDIIVNYYMIPLKP
jgi:hypothetical protein